MRRRAKLTVTEGRTSRLKPSAHSLLVLSFRALCLFSVSPVVELFARDVKEGRFNQ